ncbi:MAG: hypothetical protein EZS28_052717, partial [Streblomastix strix]
SSLIRTRWNLETLGGAEIQPNEASRAYSDCTRAVSLAESALTAEIHHILPDLPCSRYLIDAYLICVTAGARIRSIRFAYPSQGQSRIQASSNYRSGPTQATSTRDGASHY